VDKRSGTGDASSLLVLGVLAFGAYKLLSDNDNQGGGPRLPDGTPVPELDDPTMTREAAKVLANRVYAAIYGDGGFFSTPVEEDEEAVIAALLPPRTDGDVMLVAEEYGTRSGPFWAPTSWTLEGVLRAYLTPVEIARINNDYAARGINIRF